MLSGKLESFWTTIFGVFYIMTEQSNAYTKVSSWNILSRGIIFLLDAGQVENSKKFLRGPCIKRNIIQVLRALVVSEFGWSSEVCMDL